MDDGRPLTSKELRRHIASLNQLKRMCRHPTDSRRFTERVDDDDLERELNELEEELQEDLSL